MGSEVSEDLLHGLTHQNWLNTTSTLVGLQYLLTYTYISFKISSAAIEVFGGSETGTSGLPSFFQSSFSGSNLDKNVHFVSIWQLANGLWQHQVQKLGMFVLKNVNSGWDQMCWVICEL